MNLPIELRYLVVFVVFSFAIARLAWPTGHRYLGLGGGVLALVSATGLGAYLASVGGLFGLIQQPPPQVHWVWLQNLLNAFWIVVQQWLTTVQPALPALFTHLALIVVVLGVYAILKSILVTVTWALYAAWQLVNRITRPVTAFLSQRAPTFKPVVTGFLVLVSFALALIPYSAHLVRPAWNAWQSFDPAEQTPPTLPGYMLFLKRTVRNSLLLLGLLLATLPYTVQLDPLLPDFFALLFWVGLWILLLEVFQWLASAVFEPLAAPKPEANAEDDSLSRSLEALYRDYLERHNQPDIGDKALLFFNQRREAQPIAAAPSTRHAAASAGTLATALRQRLRNYLPPSLLATLADSAADYEAGNDLLFTETLCSYHFLLFAELIQYHQNQSEAVLLLCPNAAIAQVEAALEQQVRLHQLPLTQRWAVLGRDTLGPDAQVNILISPDSALETHLFQHLSSLRPILQRLRLFICLDIQDLRLSAVRLTLGRLWLTQPRDAVRVVAQAQPRQAMEQQVRYLADFMPRLKQYRLNPQLLGRRYLLVWDENSPRRAAMMAHCFPGQPSTMELGPLLLLPAWQHDFDVVHLDPASHHNEDTLEYLRNHLLPHSVHSGLMGHGRRHTPVGHLYAAQARLVYQVEDAANLALALDHNTNFSGAPASLLNVVCGNYLLRDYQRACLYAAGNPENLPEQLRPLAVRPQGALSEMAAALGNALQAVASDSGLTRQEIIEQFLHLVPADLLAAIGVRADWVNLQRLFDLTQAQSPHIAVRLGPDEQPCYSISSRHYTTRPRYYPVCNEAGDEIARWPVEDHGLRYARGQTVLVGGKYHQILAVEAGAIHVRHQESGGSDLRPRYVFNRCYRLEPGACYQDGEPLRQRLGTLCLEIRHLHRSFTGMSTGYWELLEAMRPLAEGRLPPYSELEPALHRAHKLQNVGYLRIQQAGLLEEGSLDVVAFTLCAVLQDCLVSLFPSHSARLAVVSPQSSRCHSEQDEIIQFYHQLYPTWADPVEPVETNDPATEEADQSVLEFYLFEDADHDLGVVRALCDGRGAQILLGTAGDYLEWALSQLPETLYQAYGASSLPDCLDYAGAKRVLDKLRREWHSPAVARLDGFDWGEAA